MFPESSHVVTLGLGTREDVDLFEFAGRQGYLIVTRDKDFDDLSKHRRAPPKVILLRCGNQTTDYIEAMIRRCTEEIGAFADEPMIDLLVLLPLRRPD